MSGNPVAVASVITDPTESNPPAADVKTGTGATGGERIVIAGCQSGGAGYDRAPRAEPAACGFADGGPRRKDDGAAG